MPTSFQTEHILYTIAGKLPGGETWSIGLRTGAVAIPTTAQLDALASNVATLFQACISSGTDGIQARNPTTWTFESVTARHVTAAGLTDRLGNPQIATTAGGSATQYQPDQIAVVFTLLSATPGRSGKGRVYIPVLSIAGIVASRLTFAQISDFADTFALFLGGISIMTGGGIGPFPICVQSRLGPGVPSQVTAVSVGDVMDTQRRRRDKLVENRVSMPV
jgi:hypothetical protein